MSILNVSIDVTHLKQMPIIIQQPVKNYLWKLIFAYIYKLKYYGINNTINYEHISILNVSIPLSDYL